MKKCLRKQLAWALFSGSLLGSSLVSAIDNTPDELGIVDRITALQSAAAAVSAVISAEDEPLLVKFNKLKDCLGGEEGVVLMQRVSEIKSALVKLEEVFGVQPTAPSLPPVAAGDDEEEEEEAGGSGGQDSVGAGDESAGGSGGNAGSGGGADEGSGSGSAGGSGSGGSGAGAGAGGRGNR